MCRVENDKKLENIRRTKEITGNVTKQLENLIKWRGKQMVITRRTLKRTTYVS